jgi:hypothetical protein
MARAASAFSGQGNPWAKTELSSATTGSPSSRARAMRGKTRMSEAMNELEYGRKEPTAF